MVQGQAEVEHFVLVLFHVMGATWRNQRRDSFQIMDDWSGVLRTLMDCPDMIRKSTPKSYSWSDGNMKSGGFCTLFFYSFWDHSYSHSRSWSILSMGSEVVIAVVRTLS